MVQACRTAVGAVAHPLVAQACKVGAPGHSSGLPAWLRRQDAPDRLVLVSCLASFLVLPFLL